MFLLVAFDFSSWVICSLCWHLIHYVIEDDLTPFKCWKLSTITYRFTS